MTGHNAAAGAALTAHMREQLGRWPPTGPLTVAGSVRRERPGWDGRIRPVAGMTSAAGTVLSVAPQQVAAVERLSGEWGRPGFDALLAAALGLDARRRLDATTVFRWSAEPAAGIDLGEWVAPDDARVPPWLRPFNGGVLCAWDEDGDYIAGVGIKRHDAHAQELSVGTEPAARGRGLARRLVATAAREVLRRGSVPTYLHEPTNLASARVAEAAGFPDRGDRVLGFWVPRATGDAPSV